MIFSCHLKQSLENTTSPLQHLEIGQNKEKLDLLDQWEQKDYITKMILEQFLKDLSFRKKIQDVKESCMLELVQITKKRISEDKLNISEKNIQMMKLLKISVQDSIGKEKGLKPFWKKSTTEMSQKLWCPTKIDCVDSDLSYSNGSVKNHMLKSWFSTRLQKQKTENKNYQKIYSQLSQSLLRKTMELEEQKTEKLELKTRKIKIKPTKEQKLKLKQWFGSYRFVYNQCIDYINNDNYRDNKDSLLKQLRNNFIKDENYKDKNTWMELPADTRDYAANEAKTRFYTGIKNIKNNNIKKFNLTFKSKRQSQTIQIRKRQYNVKRGKYKFLSEIKRTEILPELEHDICIHMDIFENFYLLVPIKLNKCKNQTPSRIISLDPGIRTFLTGYTPDGCIYHIGENDISRICRIYYYKHKLQSKMDKCSNNKRKYKMKRAINKLSEKQKNLIDESHKKISRWLLDNFDIIIIPKLETNNFCRKKMNKKVKNTIKSWRHCSFIDRLLFKNLEYGNTIIIPTEEYTSKTCSNCGNINDKLGSKKEYNCLKCHKIFDRDVNASKNILLKCLQEMS